MAPSMIPLLALLVTQGLGAPADKERSERVGPIVTALVVAPDGSGWLRGSQAGLVFHSFRDGRERTIPVRLDHVHALAFSPDGATLAIAGGRPAEFGAVELRSWPAGDLQGRLEGHDDLVYDVAWLDGGETLATAGADRVVRVWAPETGRELATLEGHSGPVLALAAAPDGRSFCSGGADGVIRVWAPAPWRSVRSLNNHLGPVADLAFRPPQAEGALATLASAGGDSTVRIWQPSIGRMVRIVRHPTPVHCVAWAHDGSHLLTGSKDGRLRIVDGDGDAVVAEEQLTDARIQSLAVPPRNAPVLVGDSCGTVLSWKQAPQGFQGRPR